jgi:hypothetical protein
MRINNTRRYTAMLKRVLVLVLSGLLIQVAGARLAFGAANGEKEAAHIQKVKAAIAKLGVGRDARVSVKLRDKTTVKGYILEAGVDHFAVADLKTASSISLGYSDVVQVKGKNNLSGQTVIFIVGIAAIILIGVLAGKAAR